MSELIDIKQHGDVLNFSVCATDDTCSSFFWLTIAPTLFFIAQQLFYAFVLIVCPPPDESQRQENQRGRLKRSKARNLLERLRHFEQDVLLFMDVKQVPFTNNQGENDLRMTKVQQKISGCFRSMAGAKIFCRVRSYLSTCRKHGVSATEALTLLFQGKHPEFMDTG